MAVGPCHLPLAAIVATGAGGPVRGPRVPQPSRPQPSRLPAWELCRPPGGLVPGRDWEMEARKRIIFF